MKNIACGFALTIAVLALTGCARQQPVNMAPPVAAPPPPAVSNGTTWNWRDVPQGQQIPITRGVFDQGGYQLFSRTGETIVIPFENQNMYVLKFGKTSGEMYFVNEGQAPTLYVPTGGFLENAAAQGAKWYPFSRDFAYERPVYMGLAPSWPEFVAMGWYPGMAFYGGYWGYRPWYPGFVGFTPMVGLNINIGGRDYRGWNDYRGYYRSNPANRFTTRTSYNYNSVGRRAPSAFGRTSSMSRPARTSGFGSGSLRDSRGSFGGGSVSRPSGSFGNSAPSGFSSTGRRSGGSFGSGPSGFSSAPRSSFGGGSFGRPSSGFGSSRPSGGFGSFGRSSGGFGGRRR